MKIEPREKTKTIRKVCTGTNDYYVYDLDEDAFGKRKRLYGKTEEELKAKVEAALNERVLKLSFQKPKTTLLSDYIIFYFKNAVGHIPADRIKRLLTLMKTAVFGSSLDIEVTELSAEMINEFYVDLTDKFNPESIVEVDYVLKRTFEITNREIVEGEKTLTDINTEEFNPPKNIETSGYASHILSPEEYKVLFDYCIKDGCTRYGRNELVIIFSMLTGLKASEIITLTAENLDFTENVVRVGKKVIPLSEKNLAWLKSQEMECMITFSPENAGEKLFLTSKGTSPSLPSVQTTLTAIAARCGLPKGVNGKALCKSYVICELENGVSVEELTERFNYRSKKAITDIRDEYEIRNLLF